LPEEHPSMVSLPDPPAKIVTPEPQHPALELEPGTVAPAPPLPALADSDEAVIGALADMAGPETLGAVLVTEQVIPRMVATVDSLDSRQLAPLVLPVHPPAGKFRVSGDGPLQISAANDERYAPYIAIAANIPVDAAVAFYRRHYPLFQQAYVELGYADGYFNDRLVSIIDHLLEAPALEGSPELVKSESVYMFEDQELEALSAGQKILLRIGPENAARIRNKLAAFRAAITQEAP